jgi:hypothetical protein
LIYVVIIALWAAVLIPIWLKRHDQISEVRSTARFSSAMKTLGGRAPAEAPMPSHEPMTRTRRSDRSETGMDNRHLSYQAHEGMDRDYERELVRRAAATRRAIVLGSLTAVLLVSLILAVVGVLPRWVPILAALPVVAFVLATAMTASARSAPARRSAPAPAPRRQAPATAPVSSAAAEDDWENWNAWDDDEESWDAVPTTLPTYVSAPRASAVPREIDRSHPGEWTGQAMVDAARAMRSRPQEPAMASAGHVDHGAETTEIPVVAYESPRAANQ